MAKRSQQWKGSINLAQPISGWMIAVMAIVLASSLIAFAVFGSVTKKARVAGITIPVGGSISVAAPTAGLLSKTLVREGEIVKAGQALFELSSARQDAQGEITALVSQQLEARARSLDSEQKLKESQLREKTQAMTQRLDNLRIELGELQQEIVLTSKRLGLAQDSVSKFRLLANNGYISGAQSQQKQEELIDIEARLSGLRRNKLQLQDNQIALQGERAALANDLAAEQAQLRRARASLQQEMVENRNRGTSLVVASQAGLVTTLTSQSGQMIAFGQVLATLIPQTARVDADSNGESEAAPLEVHLYAPSRASGFVAIGQQVLIRYQAYPYQKFGLQLGTVTDISQTPFAPAELPPSLASTILSNVAQNGQGGGASEALYRIKVKLAQQTIPAYGRLNSLKPGMTLEADILQDRRKIWEWILEPVLAISRR